MTARGGKPFDRMALIGALEAIGAAAVRNGMRLDPAVYGGSALSGDRRANSRPVFPGVGARLLEAAHPAEASRAERRSEEP